MNLLQTRSQSFISGSNEVLLQGVGLGNWLNLEHFLLGIPGSDSQIRQAILDVYGKEKYDIFWDTYYRVYTSEEDIKHVKDLGMNHVRIPVNYNLFYTDTFEKSVAIREIDRILSYCRKYEIWGIIDMHATPGGQNPDWHSDNFSGRDNFWFNSDFRNQIAELWGKIADYYKDDVAVGGYDLINEPCYFHKEGDAFLLDFSLKCTEAIRKVDSKHIIFYAGNTYSRDFFMYKHNFDYNCSYTFHLYPFLQIPDSLNVPDLKEEIRKSLQRDVTMQHLTEVLKKPLWCGETGHPLHLPGSYNALHLFVEVLEEQGIGWSLWPLKDFGAMALLNAKENSSWRKLTSSLSDNWIFWNIFTKDSILAAEKETDRYTYYRWLAGESTKGYEVFHKNLKNQKFDDLLLALDDFKFGNCSQVKELIIRNK